MASPQYSVAFGTAVLQGLGYPVTPQNLAFLQAWANKEGTKASFNPFATTLKYGSYGKNLNSVGVKNYSSFADGVAATVKTIQSHHYTDIQAALASGKADPKQHYAGLYTWSGHGYDNLAGIPSTSSGGGGSMAKVKTPTQSAEDYASSVQWALGVLNSNPELKAKLAEGEAAGWDAGRFQAAIQGTNWYKTQNAAQRDWYVLTHTDKATADARRNERALLIQQTAESLGVNLSPAAKAKIVNDSLSMGLNDAQIRTAIAMGWHYNSDGTQSGLAATAVDKIKQTANDYAVPLSDQVINNWTQRVLSGDATADDFTEYAKNQAKSMFPTLASAIDSGLTVSQYADPYKQIASQTLGINPDDVNFLDPKWQKALDGGADPTGKSKMPMSLADWATTLKTQSQYGYDQTAGARDQAAQLTDALGKMMGFA